LSDEDVHVSATELAVGVPTRLPGVDGACVSAVVLPLADPLEDVLPAASYAATE
jgi:hypothetical protein